VARRIPAADRAVRDGQWSFRDQYLGKELRGSTLGVIGLGRIGGAVATMCHRAFDMQVLYSDVVAFPDIEERIGAIRLGLSDLLPRADVVTLHLPLQDDTRGLIADSQLSLMKPGSILLNFSRGGLIDEDSLIQALHSGRIGGAALDVFLEEPLPPNHPLCQHPNVVLSPHNAAMTLESLRAMGKVVDDVMAVLEGRLPRHPVNGAR